MLEHRYLFEEVPTGLVPLEGIGRALGVVTPITSWLIDRAIEAVCHDFRLCGRNATMLHLTGGMPKQAVIKTLLGAGYQTGVIRPCGSTRKGL